MKDVVIIGKDGVSKKVDLADLKNLKLQEGEQLLIDGVVISLEQITFQNGELFISINGVLQVFSDFINQKEVQQGNIIQELNKKLTEKNIDVVFDLSNETRTDIQAFNVEGNDVLFIEAAGIATAAMGDSQEEASTEETLTDEVVQENNIKFGENNDYYESYSTEDYQTQDSETTETTQENETEQTTQENTTRTRTTNTNTSTNQEQIQELISLNNLKNGTVSLKDLKNLDVTLPSSVTLETLNQVLKGGTTVEQLKAIVNSLNNLNNETPLTQTDLTNLGITDIVTLEQLAAINEAIKDPNTNISNNPSQLQKIIDSVLKLDDATVTLTQTDLDNLGVTTTTPLTQEQLDVLNTILNDDTYTIKNSNELQAVLNNIISSEAVSDGYINKAEANSDGGINLSIPLTSDTVVGSIITITIPASANGTEQIISYQVTQIDLNNGIANIILSTQELSNSGDGVKDIVASIDGADSFKVVTTTLDTTILDTTISFVDTTVNGTNNDGITYNNVLTVNNIEAGASWYYSIDGGDNWTKGSGNNIVLPTGVHTYEQGQILVKQIDLAGNTSDNKELSSSITIDTQLSKPTITNVSDADDMDIKTVKFEGTADSDSTVKLYKIALDGVTLTYIADVVVTDEKWSYTGSFDNNSVTTIVAQSYDIAGNLKSSNQVKVVVGNDSDDFYISEKYEMTSGQNDSIYYNYENKDINTTMDKSINFATGGKGTDFFSTGSNVDIIDGGENPDIFCDDIRSYGDDRVSYINSESAIQIDLRKIDTGETISETTYVNKDGVTKTSTGNAVGDILSNVEGIYATNFDDQIVLSNKATFVAGMSGNDTFVITQNGRYIIDGGTGFDTIVLPGEESNYNFTYQKVWEDRVDSEGNEKSIYIIFTGDDPLTSDFLLMFYADDNEDGSNYNTNDIEIKYDDSITFDSTSQESMGKYIDGSVVGMTYHRVSDDGIVDITAKTNSNGEFTFTSKETITFSVGNVNLGIFDTDNIKSDKIIFLHDIVGIANRDTANATPAQLQYLKNLSVFLQTLDDDSNPYNNIVISESMISKINSVDLSIDLKTATTSDVKNALLTIDGITEDKIPTEAEALQHVEDMLSKNIGATIATPTIDLVTASDSNISDDNITNSANFVFKGSYQDGGVPKITIKNLDNNTNVISNVSVLQLSDDGSYSTTKNRLWEFDTSGLPEGKYKATITSTLRTDFIEFTVDKTNNSTLDVVNNDNKLDFTESLSLELSIVKEVFSLYKTLKITDITGKEVNLLNVDGSAKINDISVLGLKDGTLTVTMNTIDIAGNEGIRTYTITKDVLSGIANITPEQIAALNDEKVATLGEDILTAFATTNDNNGNPLIQSINLDAIDSLDVSNLSIIALTSLSNEQFSNLIDEQLAALTPEQVAVLTETQIDNLTPEQIVAIGTDFSSLNDEATLSLSNEQIVALTPDQLNSQL